MLYALRGITGKDGGDSSVKWRDLLGIARDKDANLDKTTVRDKNPSLNTTKGTGRSENLLHKPLATEPLPQLR